MRESAGIMKDPIERTPQLYTALNETTGVVQNSVENLKGIEGNLTAYTGWPDKDLNIMDKNIRARFTSLCGYRNELAVEIDVLALRARERIRADEMRVAGFGFIG